jgi:toxin CcdB
MRQFDICRNPDPASARRRPYLVVLQSDFLSNVDSVVVAPLAPTARTKPVARLTPVTVVAGTEHSLLVQEMGAVPRQALKRVLGTMASQRDEILAAIDLVFIGF